MSPQSVLLALEMTDVSWEQLENWGKGVNPNPPGPNRGRITPPTSSLNSWRNSKAVQPGKPLLLRAAL